MVDGKDDLGCECCDLNFYGPLLYITYGRAGPMTLILHVQGTRSASWTARPTDELDNADQQVASNVFGTGIETSNEKYDVILEDKLHTCTWT